MSEVVRPFSRIKFGREYEMDEEGMVVGDYYFNSYIHGEGETPLEKWNNSYERAGLNDVFEEVTDTHTVKVTPVAFEISSGTCNASLHKDEFDLWEYDVNHIDDIIEVATKAKELYEKHFNG